MANQGGIADSLETKLHFRQITSTNSRLEPSSFASGKLMFRSGRLRSAPAEAVPVNGAQKEPIGKGSDPLEMEGSKNCRKLFPAVSGF